MQVVGARSRQAQELAVLKLYAVLSQAHFVKQQAEEWEGAFLGILALGFPLLLKHTAEIVIHSDKGYSNMVSSRCTLHDQVAGRSWLLLHAAPLAWTSTHPTFTLTYLRHILASAVAV